MYKLLIFSTICFFISIRAESNDGGKFDLRSHILSGLEKEFDLHWKEFYSDKLINDKLSELAKMKESEADSKKLQSIDNSIKFFQRTAEQIKNIHAEDRDVLTEISKMLPNDIFPLVYAISSGDAKTKPGRVIGVSPWVIKEGYAGPNRNCSLILPYVAKLDSLIYLDISFCETGGSDFESIKKLRKLKYFAAPESITDIQLNNSLAALPSLEYLELWNCKKINGSFAKNFTEDSNLSEVAFWDTPIKTDNIGHILGMKRIFFVAIDDRSFFSLK